MLFARQLPGLDPETAADRTRAPIGNRPPADGQNFSLLSNTASGVRIVRKEGFWHDNNNNNIDKN